MGKPSTATHKTVWMFRSDDEDLTKLKRLLVVRNVTTTAGATTPNALGIAIRIAVKQLEQDSDGYPRQGEPADNVTFGPFTASALTHSESEGTP